MMIMSLFSFGIFVTLLFVYHETFLGNSSTEIERWFLQRSRTNFLNTVFFFTFYLPQYNVFFSNVALSVTLME